MIKGGPFAKRETPKGLSKATAQFFMIAKADEHVGNLPPPPPVESVSEHLVALNWTAGVNLDITTTTTTTTTT